MEIKKEIKERFESWWRNEDIGEPLMRIVAKKDNVTPINFFDGSHSYEDLNMNPSLRVAMVNDSIRCNDYLEDSYPYVDINLGPGSMATYLESEPVFNVDTIWYNETKKTIEELAQTNFDKDLIWWDKHLNRVKEAVSLSKGKTIVSIPDIQEGIDILSAIISPQELCYALYDSPELIKNILDRIDKKFYYYFEEMYNATKLADGSSAFTAFCIYGLGRTAKIQCDFSALISEEFYNEYALPYLTKQCDYLNHSLYHLDGKDAVKHLPSILKMKKLSALQFTPGAGQSDAGSDEWFSIYDKVKDSGKALWVQMYDGDSYFWAEKAKKIIKRYGTRGIYFVFADTDQAGAKLLMKTLKKH